MSARPFSAGWRCRIADEDSARQPRRCSSSCAASIYRSRGPCYKGRRSDRADRWRARCCWLWRRRVTLPARALGADAAGAAGAAADRIPAAARRPSRARRPRRRRRRRRRPKRRRPSRRRPPSAAAAAEGPVPGTCRRPGARPNRRTSVVEAASREPVRAPASVRGGRDGQQLRRRRVQRRRRRADSDVRQRARDRRRAATASTWARSRRPHARGRHGNQNPVDRLAVDRSVSSGRAPGTGPTIAAIEMRVLRGSAPSWASGSSATGAARSRARAS